MNLASHTYINKEAYYNIQETCKFISHTHQYQVMHLNDSVTHIIETCYTSEWVMSQMRMGHVTHMDESNDTQKRIMTRHTHHSTSSHDTHTTARQDMTHLHAHNKAIETPCSHSATCILKYIWNTTHSFVICVIWRLCRFITCVRKYIRIVECAY